MVRFSEQEFWVPWKQIPTHARLNGTQSSAFEFCAFFKFEIDTFKHANAVTIILVEDVEDSAVVATFTH